MPERAIYPAGRRHFRVEAVLYQPETAGDDHL
jgi:hypothetical protein